MSETLVSSCHLKKDGGNMLLSVSYRTMGFQDGSGSKGIKWNRFWPLADQLQTKQTNSINCNI